MKNLIPVEGRPNLYRDANSGAIINTDNSSYKQHLKYCKKVEEEKNKIDVLENDVETIKNELSDIKMLLTSLVNKP